MSLLACIVGGEKWMMHSVQKMGNGQEGRIVLTLSARDRDLHHIQTFLFEDYSLVNPHRIQKDQIKSMKLM